ARTVSMGNVPFKILVLDEADNMTADAQQALRRTMEMYTSTCRFILACNYYTKIIEPIQSRCALFRFMPLKPEDVKARVKYICDMEGVEITQDGMEALIYIGNGDLRKIINTLQAAAALSKKVDEASVLKVAGRVSPKELKEVLEKALSGDFSNARSKIMNLMFEYGLSGLDIIKQLHREVIMFDIDEKTKLKIIEILGETEYRILEGGTDDIQLNTMIAKLALLGSNK
ncbi:MAG: replication factor C small subunit, partial [Candidatus Methanomethylicaceae archaeon]